MNEEQTLREVAVELGAHAEALIVDSPDTEAIGTQKTKEAE